MIILRKLGAVTTGCRVILSDPLQGVADGSNQVFTVSEEYTPGRIEILYNGQVLTSPTDFEETGPQEITFVYLKPLDITVLEANYQVGDCESGSSGPPGSVDFLGLTDTPTTYSGHAGQYVKVKADGSGLEFVSSEETGTQEGITNIPNGVSSTAVSYPSAFRDEDYVLVASLENKYDSDPSVYPLLIREKTSTGFVVDVTGDIDSDNYYINWRATQSGIDVNDFMPPGFEGAWHEDVSPLVSGTTSVDITFDSAFLETCYVLTVAIENKGDSETSVYPTLIRNKDLTGFTVDFSGEIDSDNYYLNWRATDRDNSSPCGGGGICELVDDTTPQLGGDLGVGDHLIMLDPAPNGMTMHGYEVGHSGQASEMYVFDNPTGFACPLYMRSDGRWAACTAASGTTQMPCVALALEEGDGSIKKVFWDGLIRKGDWNWTPNDPIYVSTVEGAITNVKPNSGAWAQRIGTAISQDTIKFSPDLSSENPNI